MKLARRCTDWSRRGAIVGVTPSLGASFASERSVSPLSLYTSATSLDFDR